MNEIYSCLNKLLKSKLFSFIIICTILFTSIYLFIINFKNDKFWEINISHLMTISIALFFSYVLVQNKNDQRSFREIFNKTLNSYQENCSKLSTIDASNRDNNEVRKLMHIIDKEFYTINQFKNKMNCSCQLEELKTVHNDFIEAVSIFYFDKELDQIIVYGKYQDLLNKIISIIFIIYE